MKKIIAYLLLLLPLQAKAIDLVNPVRANSVAELVGNIIRGVLGIVGALALFYLVWGGILWMTSGGNSDKVKKGKDSIVWAIFGMAIIFFSYAVISFVVESLSVN